MAVVDVPTLPKEKFPLRQRVAKIRIKKRLPDRIIFCFFSSLKSFVLNNKAKARVNGKLDILMRLINDPEIKPPIIDSFELFCR